MNPTPIGEILFRYHLVHTEAIQFLEGLSEAQLSWQPHPSANSIAFYAWHLARWADYVHASGAFDQRLGPRRQIWHAEDLAAKWGLDPAALGDGETGWEMDPAGVGRMSLPGKAVLLDYVRRCQAAEEATLAVLDEQLFEVVSPGGKRVGFFVMEHLLHEWEHYGMMRYVAGLYDLTFPDQVPAKKPVRERLPSECPNCGEAISVETVRWIALAEAQCPHCQNFIAIG